MGSRDQVGNDRGETWRKLNRQTNKYKLDRTEKREK
jgi:hypothetical protein